MKIRRKIEDLFFKPITLSMDNMNKFKEKEMMKKRLFAKNIWYDGLINCILEPKNK